MPFIALGIFIDILREKNYIKIALVSMYITTTRFNLGCKTTADILLQTAVMSLQPVPSGDCISHLEILYYLFKSKSVKIYFNLSELLIFCIIHH